ncbi:hypothetical protein S83_031439, partial [Arachis hypogaea]
KSQKSLRFDLASAVQVTLISSTPLSLFLFTATLTPAFPPVCHFSSRFFASRLIHHLSSNFAARCHRSSLDFVVQLVQLIHTEVPLKTPKAIEVINMLSPSYRKKIEELGMDEDEFSEKPFEIKGEIPEPIEMLWAGPMVVCLPSQDWPPLGWEVDKDELARCILARRVSLEQLEGGVIVEKVYDTGTFALDRYKVFLKQYKEWVDTNRDRLDEESYLLYQCLISVIEFSFPVADPYLRRSIRIETNALLFLISCSP